MKVKETSMRNDGGDCLTSVQKGRREQCRSGALPKRVVWPMDI